MTVNIVDREFVCDEGEIVGHIFTTRSGEENTIYGSSKQCKEMLKRYLKHHKIKSYKIEPFKINDDEGFVAITILKIVK